MRPLLYNRQAQAVMRKHPTAKSARLYFRSMSIADMACVEPFIGYSKARTCDFTIGGMFMWVDYFNYSYGIVDDTLFVKGVVENDMNRTAFSLPVGKMPLRQSLDLLGDYCSSHGLPFTMSAVPETVLYDIKRVMPSMVADELVDWADYLYEADALSTFSGKKLNKKRNHLNRFIADNPSYDFAPVDASNIESVLDFFERQHLSADKSVTADYERLQVFDVLRHYDWYPFEGAVLSTPGDGVVAFTIGEVVGDTLFVHIEKMNHDIAGSGEMICRNFVDMELKRHPGIRYVNREEDTGDEGLRKAKMAYHPCAMLKKYNVTIL